MADLSAQLEDPACRLLTLVGLGGFGKTRLAMRLGELSLEKSELFADGVFFVALDGLADGELVTPAIAAALQFAFQEQQDETDQLLSYLANKQLLLILDNADQILVGDSIEAILARAPQVKILATSREALNFQQEWFHPLDGLGTTESDGSLNGTMKDEFARMRFSYFSSLHVGQIPDLASHVIACMLEQICRLVDGVPLGIELAAAWLKALSCEQVAQELAQSLDFLSTSLRNIPPRHRSMRVVLDQTWHYLSSKEQQTFRRLSIFAGGCRQRQPSKWQKLHCACWLPW